MTRIRFDGRHPRCPLSPAWAPVVRIRL